MTADGELSPRLDEVARVVDLALGPEQDPGDPIREGLQTSRDTSGGAMWIGARSPATHEEAYDFDVWISWLRRTYAAADRSMPTDPFTVPAVAAELWGLWRMHCAAVEDEADPRDLNLWHATLEATMHRVETWTSEARRARELARSQP